MTRIVTILVLLLTFSLIGCQTTPETPDDETTVVSLSPKQEYLEQIDRRYENPEAHYQLGRIYYSEGALNKAEHSYKVAIGFRPVHYRAQAGLVKVAADQKQADRAQIIAELYISQVAVSSKASLRLGKAFQNEDLGEYALSCYYQASGLDPEWSEPYKQIGLYYLAEGDKVRAEENLRRSFELNPYQPEVSAELGRLGVSVHTPRKAPEPVSTEAPAGE